MKKVTFVELIKAINSLDYVDGAPNLLKFKVKDGDKESLCKACIEEDDPGTDECLSLYKDGNLVLKIDPDWMELYDTIRRVSIYLECTDTAEYYIYK